MKQVSLVIVADDEPTMREMVAHHLRTFTSPKLEVLEASDGEEALRLARKHRPDLIVLDVMMPEMSGWEVCKAVRKDAALVHTGIVMLTGIGHTTNEMTSPVFGADEYIDKPFEFPELDAKVKGALAARAKKAKGTNGVIGLAKAVPRDVKATKKKTAKKKVAAKKKKTSGKAAAKRPAKKKSAKKKR